MWKRLIIVILVAMPLVIWSMACGEDTPGSRTTTPTAPATPDATSPGTTTQWTVDPVHSNVIFKIKHLDISYIYGRFNTIEGSFSTGENPSFAFTVLTDSIDTNNAKRDAHLKSPDFFAVKQFPTISFKSTGAVPTATGYELTGDLTLHGVTRSITVDLHVGGQTVFPPGTQRFGIFTQFTINRSDYAMDQKIGPAGDEVTLMVSIEGTLAKQ